VGVVLLMIWQLYHVLAADLSNRRSVSQQEHQTKEIIFAPRLESCSIRDSTWKIAKTNLFFSPRLCQHAACPKALNRFSSYVTDIRITKICLPILILVIIINYQCSETNVMHFLFSLLRIKGLYMFRVLLAHPQEVLHKRQLVYCVRQLAESGLKFHSNPGAANWHNVLLCSASWGWASNTRNIYGPLILNKLNKKCLTLVSLYWYTMTQVNKTLKHKLLDTTERPKCVSACIYIRLLWFKIYLTIIMKVRETYSREPLNTVSEKGKHPLAISMDNCTN
jgi:hypothetical protein